MFCFIEMFSNVLNCMSDINSIKHQSCHYIETSQLICRANQLTRFYVMGTSAFNGLSCLTRDFTSVENRNLKKVMLLLLLLLLLLQSQSFTLNSRKDEITLQCNLFLKHNINHF